MDTKKLRTYLIIAFGWTWAGWISAYLLSLNSGIPLVTDTTIFNLIEIILNGKETVPQVLFFLAVYGPLVGYIVVNHGKAPSETIEKNYEFILLAFILPVLIIVPSFLLCLFFGDRVQTLPSILIIISTIGLYFVSNIATSGTEEFGWRGFLYPYLKQTQKTFWDVAWKGGLIWAVWHYPLLVILYIGQGFAVLLPSLVGFTAGIVAMNYISNFIYEKTKSVPLLMAMHALNNTVSFALLLFYPQTPFLIVVHAMTWVAVAYLEKKYKIV